MLMVLEDISIAVILETAGCVSSLLFESMFLGGGLLLLCLRVVLRFGVNRPDPFLVGVTCLWSYYILSVNIPVGCEYSSVEDRHQY